MRGLDIVTLNVSITEWNLSLLHSEFTGKNLIFDIFI